MLSSWMNSPPLPTRKTTTASVATDQSTTSTSYTDLTTSGPAVTVITGTLALVVITSHSYNSGANDTFMSFAVSGATTTAASDSNAKITSHTTGNQASSVIPVTLTAGSNVFTCKYRVATGTGNFLRRQITVIPLN